MLEQADSVDVFDLAERAEDAKRIVRGERFYDAELLEGALNTFRETMSLHLCCLLFPPPSSSTRWRAI